MIQLNRTASKLKMVSADPDNFNSVATWKPVGSFKCAYRAITSNENVRAGRDAGNTGLRIFFDPRRISFALGDKVSVDKKEYSILFVPPTSIGDSISCIDTKAVQ
jgi:hypothetical protein